MFRSTRGVASLTLVAALMSSVLPVPAAGQDDAAGTLCVLSTDEMSQLAGVPLSERASAGLECAYSADPAARAVQVVLSIIPPDPTATVADDDSLLLVRMDHPGGRDGQVGGLPAWIAPDGVWVDIGDDLLSVWLNLVFDAAPPPMPGTAVAIAEAALPLYLAHPRPSPTPRSAASGIVARFPEAIGDQPLDVLVIPGPDLFDQLEAFAGSPEATAGIADLRAAIESTGVSLDAVEAGIADVFDFDSSASLSIVAIQVPGQDASVLLEPAVAAFVDFADGTPEPRSVGGRELVVADEPPGGEDRHRWFFAEGDVLWALSGDQVLVEALVEALPPPSGAR